MKKSNTLFEKLTHAIIATDGKDLLTERATIDVYVLLTFLIGGITYGVSLWLRSFYTLALICFVNSTVIVGLYFLFKIITTKAKIFIFYIVGFYFALYNVFGSGSVWSTFLLLWVLLIVNFAFYTLDQKHAYFFGLTVLSMIAIKAMLVHLTFNLPAFMERDFFEAPKNIDILVPVLLNLFLVFSTYRLYYESIRQLNRAFADTRLLNLQLERSRHRYSTIVEKSPEYIISHTLTGRVTFVNSLVATKLGIASSHLVGKHLTDIFTSISRASVDRYLELLTQTSHAEGVFKNGTDPDTEYFSYRSSLIIEETGVPIALLFAGDSTETENNTQTILTQVEDLVSALSCSIDAIILVNKNGIVRKCWSTLCSLPQFSDMHNKSIFDLLNRLLAENFVVFQEAYLKVLKNLSQEVFSVGATLNGEHRYLRIKIIPLTGKFLDVSAAVNITDITTEYQAEIDAKVRLDKLRRYQVCLSKLSHSDITSNVTLHDTLNVILKETALAIRASMISYWKIDPNDNAIECMGFWRDELLAAEQDDTVEAIDGLPTGCLECECLSFCELKTKVIKYLNNRQWYNTYGVTSAASKANQTNATGTSQNENCNHFLLTPSFMSGSLQGVIGIQSIEGNPAWDELDTSFSESVLIIISLVIEADKNKRAIEQAMEYSQQLQTKNNEMATMMTYLSQAQKRAEKSESLKTMFLANMSHEIRTPMNAIMGFSELLENTALSDKKRIEFSRAIRTRSSDLLTIVNNILDFTKLEAGMVTLNEVEGNVNEFIERIIAGVIAETRYLSNKQVELLNANELKGEANIMKCDFIRLYQTLTNLIHNAIKFTYNGSIQVGCKEEQDSYLFFVADTGIGIAKNKMEDIFESFRQADESIHEKFGGSGLGLAICKGNVEMWGGRIWVESELCKGSTFYFTVPKKK